MIFFSAVAQPIFLHWVMELLLWDSFLFTFAQILNSRLVGTWHIATHGAGCISDSSLFFHMQFSVKQQEAKIYKVKIFNLNSICGRVLTSQKDRSASHSPGAWTSSSPNPKHLYLNNQFSFCSTFAFQFCPFLEVQLVFLPSKPGYLLNKKITLEQVL